MTWAPVRRVGAVLLLVVLIIGTGVSAERPGGDVPPPPAAQHEPARPVLRAQPVSAVDVALPASTVVAAGHGTLTAVGGTGAVVGTGPLLRYVVEVESGIGVDPAGFAAAAERTLADPRSWTARGKQSFQRVDTEPVDFRLVLASPALTDRLCAPLDTQGAVSCHQDGRAVVNALRWATGAPAYDGRLADYRHYVVNHEVGHALGHGHAVCPGAGQPAPVMLQQTLGVGECLAQPWPYG